MISKTRLLLLILLATLLVYGALNLDFGRISAAESPAIYASPPAMREDPTSAIGTNFTYSVYTDYAGADIWGYEFTLTFNPNVLEGVEVVNGNLIIEDVGPTMWSEGTFNNTDGTLSLTGNGFFALPPADPPVTSGPGILANVTFTVVGYGISNIALGDDTRLIGYDSILGNFNIIDDTLIGHMEGGIFYSLIPGDIDGDGYVGSADAGVLNGAYGSYEGDALYTLETDFDLDGYIGSADAGILNGAYGTSYT